MHLYALPDHQPDPETNEGLHYLGRIFLEDHMACSHLFEIAQQHHCDVHPFEDVRLDSVQVQRLTAIFVEHANTIAPGHAPAYRRLLAVLDLARQQHVGIYSFCD